MLMKRNELTIDKLNGSETLPSISIVLCIASKNIDFKTTINISSGCTFYPIKLSIIEGNKMSDLCHFQSLKFRQVKILSKCDFILILQFDRKRVIHLNTIRKNSAFWLHAIFAVTKIQNRRYMELKRRV